MSAMSTIKALLCLATDCYWSVLRMMFHYPLSLVQLLQFLSKTILLCVVCCRGRGRSVMTSRSWRTCGCQHKIVGVAKALCTVKYQVYTITLRLCKAELQKLHCLVQQVW